ncbi:MAG: chemotaxis protein CheX [Campylobacterota bacterium]|nr:chemotaxis protein CheX [Campylobacterota bacterium]
MTIKFFGHYLLNNGCITEEQLVEAVNYQTQNNSTLGELAVEKGFIKLKEANKINDKQRALDKRFGDVAISLGLLTETQIDELIALQKKNKVFFGEVLLLKNFISKDELDKELCIFNEEQNIEVQKIDDQIETMDNKELIKHSINVLQTLFLRVIHDNIKLVKIYPVSSVTSTDTISLQKMMGEENLDFALQAEDSVAINITSEYLKIPYTEMDEMVLDVLSEFVNVVLGNIAVKLSSDNIVVDLTPPNIIQASSIDNQYHAFEFTTTHGCLILYLKF